MIHDDRLAAALLRVAKGILASCVASGRGKQHCSFRQGGPHSHGWRDKHESKSSSALAALHENDLVETLVVCAVLFGGHEVRVSPQQSGGGCGVRRQGQRPDPASA